LRCPLDRLANYHPVHGDPLHCGFVVIPELLSTTHDLKHLIGVQIH
jgi:hypothetical protein